MGRLTFILGGARSGKSDHAQRLAEAGAEPVTFIATAQALDEEMRQRIDAHRQRRSGEWVTLELSTGVGKYMSEHAAQGGVVLLDCLTLLISNVMLQAGADPEVTDEAGARAAVEHELAALREAIENSKANWIVISNEVGQGIVPAYPAGRLFRDLLGWANQMMAGRASDVIWMVAGIPVPIQQHRS